MKFMQVFLIAIIITFLDTSQWFNFHFYINKVNNVVISYYYLNNSKRLISIILSKITWKMILTDLFA